MKSVFELMILASSIVGMMSAAHLATIQVRSRVVSALDMTKIGTASFAVAGILLLIFSPRSLFSFWICVQAPLAVGVASAFLLAKQRDRAVAESLDNVLARLMMRMREGQSLAVALERVACETRASLRPRWIEVARSVSFSSQKTSSNDIRNDARVELRSARLIEIASELRRIDQLNRSQLAEVERWRVRLRVERTFRRRSVQAMAQTRAQSIVLSLIFAMLSAFSVYAFGWSSTRGPFQISIPLFLAGLFFIWRGGRRVKWSI